MLQLLRGKKSDLLIKIILVLITIGFSFFGIESYFVANTNTSVAKVGGVEISQDEFRDRFSQYRQRMTQMFGSAVDAAYFAKPEVKKQVLDQLIDEQVLIAANDKLGVRVPDESIRQEILKIPAFQTNGTFDPDIYRRLLASQGMSPQDFEQRVRRDLAPRELPQQVGDTTLVTDAEVDNYLRLKEQRRDFRYVKIDKPTNKPVVALGSVMDRLNKLADERSTDVGPLEIDAYYKEHSADFMTPEQVSLNYLELEGAKLPPPAAPDDSVLKERYEKEKARFVTDEQREASHILVKVGGNGSPDDQKKALAKAEDIEKEIKSGKSFADVAKQESDDLGSKNQGGDLGWIDKGTTVEAFENALFAMKKDEISAPVLSSEGYHIIQLRDIRPGKTRTFDEVKPELTKDYANTERDRLFSEKAGRLTDLTYQDPASLDTAAKDLSLTVKKTGLFSRNGGGIGIAANQAVSKAAFSDDVLVQNNNSGAIDIGSNHIVVVRIAEHKPATPTPIDQVREQIRTKILAERAARKAKDTADGLFARLNDKGETLDQIAAAQSLNVEEQKNIGREAANVDGALVKAAFSMPRPQEGKPGYQLVPLTGDNYALLQLDKVVDGDPAKLDAKAKDAARTTLTQAASTLASRDFVSALRGEAQVRIFDDKLQQEL